MPENKTPTPDNRTPEEKARRLRQLLEWYGADGMLPPDIPDPPAYCPKCGAQMERWGFGKLFPKPRPGEPRPPHSEVGLGGCIIIPGAHRCHNCKLIYHSYSKDFAELAEIFRARDSKTPQPQQGAPDHG